eukprot:4630468-Pyramimonas_sp.AAC.1
MLFDDLHDVVGRAEQVVCPPRDPGLELGHPRQQERRGVDPEPVDFATECSQDGLVAVTKGVRRAMPSSISWPCLPNFAR